MSLTMMILLLEPVRTIDDLRSKITVSDSEPGDLLASELYIIAPGAEDAGHIAAASLFPIAAAIPGSMRGPLR